MNKEPFETMPDVIDAKQIAEVLRLSKAGAYNLLNDPNFPTLRIGGRRLVMKQDFWSLCLIESDELQMKRHSWWNGFSAMAFKSGAPKRASRDLIRTPIN